MRARSFSYRLSSWPERFTILCLATALTVASLAGPSATLIRKQSLPPIVYLFHPNLILMHGDPFTQDDTTIPGAEWRRGPLLTYPAGLAADFRTSGWVDVACDVSATGWPANCQVDDHDGDKRFIDAAVLHVSRARYSPAHHIGLGITEPVATQYTFHVAFDANSASRLDRRDGPALVYPRDMLASRREGWADVQCDIAETGQPSGCKVLGSSADAFGRSALTYIARGTYDTTTDDETSVIYLHHRFHVEFHPDD